MLRPGDRLGPYRLIDKIGSGAFGAVWLGEKRTPLVSTRVAIKIPFTQDCDLASLKTEATVWAQVTGHPNVLPIIDADIYDNTVVIVSEYAPSGSLADWLTKHGGGSPSITGAVGMVDGILAGLEHLHTRDVIHRDIKPANVLLQGQTPRLADFGIARLIGGEDQSVGIAGTLAYMSPEALDGHRSPLTDLWSAGVLLYECLSGRRPFVQREAGALVRAIASEPATPLPSSVPDRIQEVVSRALDKSPQHRYQTATEMRDALRPILHEANIIGASDVRPLDGNDLGNGLRLGGIYRGVPLGLVAGNWINYYDTGWVRSGWFYSPERTHNFAETFFKVHIFHDGHGYIHLLASANPDHVIWLETATGFRKEASLAWTSDTDAERTDFWPFSWKS